MKTHEMRMGNVVAMVGEEYGQANRVDGSQKGERKRQDCYDGVQQQKRVTGFCRVPARARLTACKNSLITWG
ncbi:uncharacterized protein N7482_005369 [Penicillium canariense]|uniref:Uncharacterized protein n=1 Tax=Penicillium canariense TaxID=189055 RepID=A0A9W9I4L0_9EURO|nr:uncharacterized protein N7482_005369 [Penicillium canariense]KAJ5166588.1 hypothetical protein N7482_005369 [Penicillium canariense]